MTNVVAATTESADPGTSETPKTSAALCHAMAPPASPMTVANQDMGKYSSWLGWVSAEAVKERSS